MKPEYRVIVKVDTDPDTSWLEQWDTPEKYYGGAPKCSHGKPMEYRCGHGWEGDHSTDDMCCNSCNGDYGCNTDDCPCHQCTEYVDYDGHGNKEGAQLIDKRRGMGTHDYVPFDVYKTTWGDPNRHVFLCFYLQRRDPPCNACGRAEWETVDSLHGIDFMDWRCPDTGTFSLEEIKHRMTHGMQEDQYLFGEIWAVIRNDLEKGDSK